ncbi:MAG: DUF480 domain-containing protein [Hafnia sp.]
MKNPLSPLEARVIGCFLEKQVTTPDQYPLSLNGLTTACNQKTNRDPVLELSESDVQSTLDMLMKKHQVRSLSIPGSRVMKYEHRFCNSEFGNLKFSEAEVAVVCCLLLRGPQTPGELTEGRCQLEKIKAVIADDSLDDVACFQRIEEIVCILEAIGASAGNRHDFG